MRPLLLLASLLLLGCDQGVYVPSADELAVKEWHEANLRTAYKEGLWASPQALDAEFEHALTGDPREVDTPCRVRDRPPQ